MNKIKLLTERIKQLEEKINYQQMLLNQLPPNDIPKNIWFTLSTRPIGKKIKTTENNIEIHYIDELTGNIEKVNFVTMGKPNIVYSKNNTVVDIKLLSITYSAEFHWEIIENNTEGFTIKCKDYLSMGRGKEYYVYYNKRDKVKCTHYIEKE